MSRYIATPIRELGTVVTGKTPKTSEKHYYNGEYMFITPVELHDGYNITISEKTITEAGLNSISSNSICGTSVLVGCIGWDMGNVAMCHERCATNQQINAITKFKPQYNPYYTYYWLSQKKEYLFSIASVTRTPILSKGTFEEVEIPMPLKNIQDSVVDVLRSFDEKIAVNKCICSELYSVAEALYDYWFTQFDFPNEEGKPYRSSGGEMVWNDQLKREIPKGWDVTTMASLAPVLTGKEDANFSTSNGNYKFFTCAQETMRCDTPAFSGHAVLIAGNGDFNVKHFTGSFNAYQRTYVLMPKEAKHYAVMYIATQKRIQAFKQGANGSIVKFITKGDVENIPIILPDNDSLLNTLNQILEKIEHCERENDELKKLRDWLLPMLMNGQAIAE